MEWHGRLNCNIFIKNKGADKNIVDALNYTQFDPEVNGKAVLPAASYGHKKENGR